jgi:DNA-binding CsgD family transcriptional regulator
MGRSAAFVGREAEFARLDEAVARGGQLVLVTGDAGIGKSRLVAEGLRRAAGSGVVSFWGNCLPLREPLPLFAVTEALRELTRLCRPRVQAAVERLNGPAREQVSRLLPLIARPDGGDAPRGGHRAGLFTALADLLVELDGEGPVALVVEDVQWADPATLDLLTYLASTLGRSRLTLLITMRSDEPAVHPAVDGWLANLHRGRALVVVQLEALSRNEVRRLAHALTGNPPADDLVDGLFDRAEGNPFYTEQLVAAAREASAGPAELPFAVAELLASRLRQVSGGAQQALLALAVAKRPLAEEHLAAITGQSPSEVRAAVRGLANARLLSAPTVDGAYRLRHALLGAAARESLLPGERASLHARVAEALLALADDTYSGEMAEHWRAAGRPAAELAAALAAAGFATRVFAHAEAAAYLHRVIELSGTVPVAQRPDTPTVGQIYVMAIDAYAASGEVTRASSLAEEALRLFADHDDRVLAAAIHTWAARFRGIGHGIGALPLLETALDLLEGTAPTEDHAAALWQHFLFLRGSGDLAAAERSLYRAWEIAQAARATTLVPRIVAAMAQQRFVHGQIDEGLTLLARARAAADAENDSSVLSVATTETDILLRLGRLPEVGEVAARGLRAAAREGLGGSFLATLLVANASEAELGLGRVIDAAERLDPVTAGPVNLDRWPLHLLRAQVDLLRGRIADARDRLVRIEVLPIGGNPSFIRMIAEIGGEIALWDGRPSDAGDGVQAALGHVDGTDDVAFAGWLLVIGARAFADLAVRAVARREGGVHAARARCDELAAWRQRQATDPFAAEHPYLADTAAQRLSWVAECGRAACRNDPDAWVAAADAWLRLHRPHRAAYAHWRAAEVLLDRGRSDGSAATALSTAARLAEGNSPLLDAITALARRARITLDTPAVEAVSRPAPADPYGLTEREYAVLSLIVAGRTNAEIGTVLFISPKTASVHVTNLLRKLGVTNRVQAAALAERAGLTRPS